MRRCADPMTCAILAGVPLGTLAKAFCRNARRRVTPLVAAKIAAPIEGMATLTSPFLRRRVHTVTAGTSAACLVLALWANSAAATLSSSADARVSRAHVLTGGSAHRSVATLDVVSGTTSVQVSTGIRSGLLYRVSSPAGSGIRPLVTLDHGTLRVGQTSDGDKNRVATIDIQLARGVRWAVNLDGGATTETVNMDKGSLSSLSFGAGVAMAYVRLPAPVGTLTLTLAGGATQLLVVASSGAPAQVKVVGGASQVSLYGSAHTGVAGGSVFADPAWAHSNNRYAIDLLTGVSDFQMSRS